MSDVAAELSVLIAGKETGLKTMLAEISSALKKADADAQKAGESIGSSTAAGAQRAAREAISLAQGYARLANASGDTAEAIRILKNALEQNGAAGEKVLVQVQNQVAGLERQAASAKNSAGAFQQLTQAAGTLGIAIGAQQIIQGAINLGQIGATAAQTATRFQQLAAAAGQSGDQILTALKKASGGQISDLNLELAANRANLLGVATSAEQLGTLMSIARDRAQSLGTSATEAFNDLVTGLGRGSPLILDNLGIMVNVQAANEAYAVSVGKTVAQLSDAEKKQALINQVVADGKAKLLETGGAAETTAGKFTALGIAAENAGTKLGGALANTLSDAAVGGTVVLDALIKRFDEMGAAQEKLANNDALVRSSDNYAQYTAQVQALSRETGNAYANIGALTEAQFLQAKISQTGSVANQAAAAGVQQVGIGATEATAPVSALATALDDEAQKALINQVNSQALGFEKDRLSAAAQNAAGAVLASGGNIEAEAARLAASSSLVDQLTAAYLRLAAANGQAGGAQRLASQAAQTRTLATPGAGAPGRSGTSDVDAVVAQQKAISEAEAAERKYNETVGGTSVKLRNLRQDLAGASTEADRFRIKTEIASLEKSGARGGGGGGGSAAKSALNAQTTANNQLEDLERQHQEKLAQIQADGDKKRAQADESFRRSQLTGRAGFYASLASVTDDAQRKALSARYEAIQQEAAAIRQAQGSDVAQAYAEAAERALQAQSEIEQQIAEAEKNKDAGKAEYLKA